MSFFYSEARRVPKPQRHSQLPLRGKQAKRERRLLLLRQFEVGKVYTFYPEFLVLDLPNDYDLAGDEYGSAAVN